MNNFDAVNNRDGLKNNKIKDWNANKVVRFVDILKAEGAVDI